MVELVGKRSTVKCLPWHVTIFSFLGNIVAVPYALGEASNSLIGKLIVFVPKYALDLDTFYVKSIIIPLSRLRKMTSGLLLAKIEPHFVIFRFIQLKPSSDKTRLIDKQINK